MKNPSCIIQLGHWRTRVTLGRFIFGWHHPGAERWSAAFGIGMVSAQKLRTTDWTVHRYRRRSHTSLAMRLADHRART